MPEWRRSGCRRSESSEVGYDVIDGSDELPIDHVCDGDEEASSKCLAGNPVSTLVDFELFVRPALRLLSGRRILDRPTLNAVLDVAMPRRRDGKIHFVHVVAAINEDRNVHVVRVARQASRLLHAIAACDALAVVEDGDGLDIGQSVRDDPRVQPVTRGVRWRDFYSCENMKIKSRFDQARNASSLALSQLCGKRPLSTQPLEN